MKAEGFAMEITPYEDRTWDAVMQALSAEKRLLQFCKIPRHELQAIVRLCGNHTPKDLAHAFALTQQRKFEERENFLDAIGDNRIFSMLYILGRSMKCWVETEAMNDSTLPANATIKGRWKVAHS
jgi:hypothetical protein